MGKINLLELRHSREYWEDINIAALPEEARSLYLNRKKAVDLYIDGVSPKIITEETGLSNCEINRLIRKCVALDERQLPVGYAALILRKRNIKSVGKMQKLFLQYPSLESFVHGNYFNDKKFTLEHNMNVRTLHVKFIDECIRLGIQNYEYPFTLKDKGYDALVDYIKQVEATKQSKTIRREGKDAIQRFESTGYGESISFKPLNPYGAVQIDGHKIDLLYTVEVENEQGETILMPATRAWLIAIIDIATRAIIGYHITPYENYNHSDVLMAVHNSIVPHEKINFTHSGFSYPENGGFPSLAIPETQWASFDMIMLDNAKSHLAQNTMDKLLNHVKCSVNFGSVATPETRGIVERFFKTLELSGFHRLPGTTGSNTRDTKRHEPEKESVKYRISYNDICELVEYLIAEYNTSAHSSLENQTPLQVMERRIKEVGIRPFIVPAEERKEIEKLTYFSVERTVRGAYSTGSKPQVSYLGVKYHAYDRRIPMDLVNKKVYIEVNPADVSHVDLYDSDGKFIANLVAMGEWGKRPHSIRTHQAALDRKNSNKGQNSIFSPDLSLFEEDLRENSKNSRRDRTRAAIVEAEMGKPYKNPEPAEPIKLNQVKRPNKATTCTKEELDLLDSNSIEDLFKEGFL